jgi:hypothetical protein
MPTILLEEWRAMSDVRSFLVPSGPRGLSNVVGVPGANCRPTGRRGALLCFRTGSDVVLPQAFRPFSAT